MSGNKTDKIRKPDLRDGLPGREPSEAMKAEFAGTPLPSSNNEPGAPKPPAGGTTQG